MAGRNDKIVPFKTMQGQIQWFKNKNANVKTLINNWGHTFSNALPETGINKNRNCASTEWINRGGLLRCPFDQASAYMSHILNKKLKGQN